MTEGSGTAMNKIKIDYLTIDFPNYGIISTMLDDECMKYLWNSIEEGKKDNINMNKDLAGNISTSLAIKDKDNKISDYVYALIQEYEKKYNQPYQLSLDLLNNMLKRLDLTIFEQAEKTAAGYLYGFSLDSFWVNFQKQNEFNPMHNHSGVYSFVIWMKIPTEWKEQKELPIAKNSGMDGFISNFGFTYTDVLGGIRNFNVEMGKDREGVLLLFPSQMHHLVNPFYNCDEERISISGNVYLKVKGKSK